jgi:hypothetical protein
LTTSDRIGEIRRAKQAADPPRASQSSGVQRLKEDGMAGMRKRSIAAVGAAAVAFGVAGATVAGGQGSAGPPTGTLSFQVRAKEQRNLSGINPAVPRNKKRPKVADLFADNVDILSTAGQRIGKGHDFQVTTFEGARKYKGKAVSIGNAVADFGNGDLLFFQCLREDSPTNNNCAVSGGTGRYAGARGSAVEDFVNGVEDRKKRTFTFTITVTFVP